jgi:hypothetical protein
MIDVSAILRKKYFDLLKANLEVPVYDRVPTTAPDVYVYFAEFTDNDDFTDKTSFGHSVLASVVVVTTFRDGSGGKKKGDDVAGEIIGLIRTRSVLNLAPFHYMITSRLAGTSTFENEIEGGYQINRQITFSHLIGEFNEAVDQCAVLLQTLTSQDKLSCILPSYDFDNEGVQDSLTEQQKLDLTEWLCSGVATVENSNQSFQENVAVGDTLVLPDITVTDSDGSTFTQPSVEDVTCTPQLKDLEIQFDIDADTDTYIKVATASFLGTITTINDGGLDDLVVSINDTPVTVPFAIALNDEIKLNYVTSSSATVVILSGSYE